MARFQVFDGFPYLITRIVPALYHVTLLPGGQPEETLLALAQAQADANRLQMCLVLGERRGVYFDVDAKATPTHEPPRGGALITGLLAPPVDLRVTADMRARKERLDALVEEVRRKGSYITGDLSKGGREATPEELTSLAGSNGDGSPRGLERCPTCQDWRGLCLDPSESFKGQVMTVHCLCDNHNRCARCGELLHDRRLNGNCYDPSDGHIWHVPGFSGLTHDCPRHLHWDAPGPLAIQLVTGA